jgi:hypothetical protein
MNQTQHLDNLPLSNWVIYLSKNYEPRTKNCFTKRTQNLSRRSSPTANEDGCKTNPKYCVFIPKTKIAQKTKPNRDTTTMKIRNEPKCGTACGLAVALGCDPVLQNKPKFQFLSSWIPEFLCSWSVCTNEPKLKMNLLTITCNR